MKIKTKLTISFCIMIFVPMILAVAILFGFQKAQNKVFKSEYGIEKTDIYLFSTSVKLLSKMTEPVMNDIVSGIEVSPDDFTEETILRRYNNELEDRYSVLLVRKNNILIFDGGTELEDINVVLKPFEEARVGIVESYLNESEGVLVKQEDFFDSDNEKMSIYIITSVEAVIPEIKTFTIEVIVAVVFILLLTALIMLAWVYGSIINPIKSLQAAADNIKNGNLDFEVKVNGDDEIGLLGATFEEMRLRLKDNAAEKIADESENRTLISNIAHDLKTPITAVKGYAEGILDGVANTPEKLDKYVRTIYNKAGEMDTLINELTLYSKIDSNRIPYNFAKINVSEYFNDCIEEIGLDLEAKNISLSYYNYVDDNVIIIADLEQLRRVINNIVNNSVKYMDKEKGHINIRIKDVGDFIQVEMEDDGKGIAQKDLPYIFDRFFRADSSRNSATGGSGIGLSIVKKIMEDHGGKIWATSKEGSGTTMYFVIRKYEEVFSDEQNFNY